MHSPTEPEPALRRPWPELLALAVWLLATAAWRPLAIPDEGRYAGVAYEMLQGDWLVPTLNGLPFFHKPPLLYWLDIGAMTLFGVNAFAARMGPAIGAFVLGAALFLHLRRWHGHTVARIGLLILATTPFFFVGGQFVNHDMGVAGCITAAVLSAVRAFEPPAPGVPRSLRWLMLAWLFCGLGVLAKGLIGIVLPGLIVVPWLLAQRRWRDVLLLLHPLGLLVFAIVAVPWMWAMQARYPGFFDYFVVEQHFHRYAAGHFNNPQPPWFFLWALPVATLPWSLWLWPAWREAGSALVGRRDWRMGLYLWWTVVVVGFFSLPASKLIGYAMPALAPWCALLALALLARPRTWPRVALVAALGCVVLVAAVAWRAPKSQREPARELAARMQPGDHVVFVGAYFYDVPFYARLKAPVSVVSDWGDPTLPQRDNWQKELHDAARFAPAERRNVLVPRDRLAALLCRAGALWFVVMPGDADPVATLPGALKVWPGPGVQLWRAPGQACPAGVAR